jgi:ketosteroid isomerase-like protein
MKHVLSYGITLLTVGMVIGCNSYNPSLSQARKSIVEQNTKRVTALRENDIDTLIGLYTEDATLLPPNDTVKKGLLEIKSFYELLPRSGRIVDASIISNSISGTGDTFYEIGEYHFSIRSFENDATHMATMKYLTVWKCQSDGSLRMFAECWNSDPNFFPTLPIPGID